MKRHDEQTYRFSRATFIKLQHQLTKIGSIHGEISENVFKVETPFPKNWSCEYLDTITMDSSREVLQMKERLKGAMPTSAKKRLEKKYKVLLQKRKIG